MENIFIGNGLSGHLQILNSTNLHNGYLSLFFMIGIPLGFMVLVLFIFAVILSIQRSNFENSFVKHFLVSFVILNFGEDFLIGLGSPIFFYVLMVFGILAYHPKNGHGLSFRS